MTETPLEFFLIDEEDHPSDLKIKIQNDYIQ